MTYSLPRAAARLSAIALFVLMAFFAVGLEAQDASGSIQGTVADPRGQVIPGATLSATSGNGAKRTTLSGADGKFSIAGLSAGTYTV